MSEYSVDSLSKVRSKRSHECLETAHLSIEIHSFRFALNQAYYAVFHAMRAVLAFDLYDSKKHSGIIGEFRRLYIKTGIFDEEMSDIITELFDMLVNSEYDDFYVASEEEATEKLAKAEKFVHNIEVYLKRIDGTEVQSE